MYTVQTVRNEWQSKWNNAKNGSDLLWLKWTVMWYTVQQWNKHWVVDICSADVFYEFVHVPIWLH